ncbi:hypothetical protein SprV_0100366100 [Sparganum proliferum]
MGSCNPPSATSLRRLNLIAALSPSNGIGWKNDLPWRIKEDTDFFTRITSTAATGTLNSVPEGVYLAKDFSNALAICENLHSDNKVDEVFVIGGTAVYEAALNQSKYPIRFYCTHVMKDYQCDVFFPDVDWKSFKEIRLPTVEPDIKHCGDVDIRFAVYEKAQN